MPSARGAERCSQSTRDTERPTNGCRMLSPGLGERLHKCHGTHRRVALLLPGQAAHGDDCPGEEEALRLTCYQQWNGGWVQSSG